LLAEAFILFLNVPTVVRCLLSRGSRRTLPVLSPTHTLWRRLFSVFPTSGDHQTQHHHEHAMSGINIDEPDTSLNVYQSCPEKLILRQPKFRSCGIPGLVRLHLDYWMTPDSGMSQSSQFTISSERPTATPQAIKYN